MTTLPCVLGLLFGIQIVVPLHGRADSPRLDLQYAISHFDSVHYTRIVESGYFYDPSRRSNVAFFPGYPLAGTAVRDITGWPAVISLLVVANLALAAAFIVFAAFLRERWPEATASQRAVALGLFGLCPAGLFFRMPYSESPFILVALLVLYGMARRWPIGVLALLAGLATGIRPVGIAVSAALVWHIVSDPTRGDRLRRELLAAAWFPISCWGLLAYMAYQDVEFGTPFAFAQTQENWTHAAPTERTFENKVLALATGEPIWSTYIPDSPRHWEKFDRHENPFFGIFFWNPIYFVGAVVLVWIGAVQRWLTGPELVLGLGLLAIPYITRGFEMSLASHARFATVVVPAYLVRHACFGTGRRG